MFSSQTSPVNWLHHLRQIIKQLSWVYSSTDQLHSIPTQLIQATHNRSKMNFNTSRSSFNQSPIIFHLTPELGKSILEMCNNEVEIYRFFCSSPGLSDSFLPSALMQRGAYLRTILLWVIGGFGLFGRADERFGIGFHGGGGRFMFHWGMGWGWTI